MHLPVQDHMTFSRAGMSRIGLFAILLLLAISIDFLVERHFYPADLLKRAEHIVEICKREGYAPTCYEREVPGLMDEGLSMEDAIYVMRQVLSLDPSYRYCHTIAHKIAGKEVTKDSTRWKEVALRAPLDICSYGFMHGAFQERFRAETLPPNAPVAEAVSLFDGVCLDRSWSERTEGEQTNCVHALGHLILYVTNADLHRSVAICDVLANAEWNDMRRSCFEGVFMQMYQPLEPEDFALIEGVAPQTLQERDSICSGFTGRPKAACMKESWPLEPQTLRTPGALASFCERVGDGSAEETEYCVSALAYITAARFQFDPDLFGDFCEQVPNWGGHCLAYGAPRFLEIYWKDISPSLSLCARAASAGAGDLCYSLLSWYSTRTFVPGSQEAEALCASLPLPWRDQCPGNERI